MSIPLKTLLVCLSKQWKIHFTYLLSETMGHTAETGSIRELLL